MSIEGRKTTYKDRQTRTSNRKNPKANVWIPSRPISTSARVLSLIVDHNPLPLLFVTSRLPGHRPNSITFFSFFLSGSGGGCILLCTNRYPPPFSYYFRRHPPRFLLVCRVPDQSIDHFLSYPCPSYSYRHNLMFIACIHVEPRLMSSCAQRFSSEDPDDG